MYTPRPVTDRLVHDHQNALLAEASANRLAIARRPRPAWRWLEGSRRLHRTKAGEAKPSAGTTALASVLAEVGGAVEVVLAQGRNPSDVQPMAELVARIADALRDVGAVVGLPPIERDEPTSVVLRWLGRLSERTISMPIALDVDRGAVISTLVSELRSLVAGGTTTAVGVTAPRPAEAIDTSLCPST